MMVVVAVAGMFPVAVLWCLFRFVVVVVVLHFRWLLIRNYMILEQFYIFFVRSPG